MLNYLLHYKGFGIEKKLLVDKIEENEFESLLENVNEYKI